MRAKGKRGTKGAAKGVPGKAGLSAPYRMKLAERGTKVPGGVLFARCEGISPTGDGCNRFAGHSGLHESSGGSTWPDPAVGEKAEGIKALHEEAARLERALGTAGILALVDGIHRALEDLEQRLENVLAPDEAEGTMPKITMKSELGRELEGVIIVIERLKARVDL